jgi:HAD superfamily hydrolase (TIGR01490 family)
MNDFQVRRMPLAIFDLDNTLLAGDSDYLWGVFLADAGLVDRDYYERENERFYREYKEGRLDIFEFLRFSLRPLSENEPGRLYELRRQFLETHIDPIILPAGRRLIASHKEQGYTPLIITATNAFVTAPIAERLDIPHLLATEPEVIDGRYTGEVRGTPCFQDGKVTRLRQWLAQRHETLEGSWFYSDSHNDIPLLEQVDNPVAVDPDDALRRHAGERGWKVISLRGD